MDTGIVVKDLSFIKMDKNCFLGFQPFEKQLSTAKHTNYARFPHKELLEFDKVVEQWRGSGLTKSEKSCPHCLLVLLKKIADEYFRYMESPRGKALLKSQNEQQTTQEDGGSAAGEQEVNG